MTILPPIDGTSWQVVVVLATRTVAPARAHELEHLCADHQQAHRSNVFRVLRRRRAAEQSDWSTACLHEAPARRPEWHRRNAVNPTELAAAARVVRDAVKDKSYRSTPIGLVAGRYLRWKRFEWGATEATLRECEIPFAYLSLDHADLQLAEFEPPAGRERLREFLDHRWAQRSPRTRAKNLSILRDFFRWTVENDEMHGAPTIGSFSVRGSCD